jgi:hypothetical protein
MDYVNTVLILIGIFMNWSAIRRCKWVANVVRTENFIRDRSSN